MAEDGPSEKLSVYANLPGDYIRLLRPHITRQDSDGSVLTVSWSLETVQIAGVRGNQSPAYTALSYCWGDATLSLEHRIQLQSGASIVTLLITKNLFDALSQFAQDEDRTSLIWADAICINQADTQERNRQVALMGRIYTSAELVMCWLGKGEYGSYEALFRLYTRLKKSIRARKGRRIFDIFDVVDMKEGFKVLEQSEWFGRAWTYQEITLARLAVLQCGSLKIPWMALATAYPHILGRLSDDFDAIMTQVRLIETARLRERKMVTLLTAIWPRSATDARDKVFAVLGMLEVSQFRGANYTLSPQEVFTQAAKDCIEQSQDLEILILAGLNRLDLPCQNARGLSDGGVALPSWVPDWESSPSMARLSCALENEADNFEEDRFEFGQHAWARPSSDVSRRAEDKPHPKNYYHRKNNGLRYAPVMWRFENQTLITSGDVIGELRVVVKQDQTISTWWSSTSVWIAWPGNNPPDMPAPLPEPPEKGTHRPQHLMSLECPNSVQEGDKVVVLHVCPAFLVLRPSTDSSSSKNSKEIRQEPVSLVGPAYIHCSRLHSEPGPHSFEQILGDIFKKQCEPIYFRID